MFQRPEITERNQLLCQTHSLDINRVSFESEIAGTNLRLLCSECAVQKNEKIKESTFKADHIHQNYIISLNDLSVPLYNKNNQNSDNSSMDFRYMEIEHVIIDDKSQGYSARNLVYLPDEQLLAACSSNGHISLWSMGEQVQWTGVFDVEKAIRFAKYINRGEHGPNYLVLGVEKRLHFYKIVGYNLVLMNAINCKLEVYDAEWMPDNDKIAIVGNGNIVQIWDVKSFRLEVTFSKLGTKGPIYRLIYLPHKNSLALEYKSEMSLIHLRQDDMQYDGIQGFMTHRSILGFAYLPNSKQFVFPSTTQEIHLVDEDTLYSTEKSFADHEAKHPPPDSSHVIVNENESQFLCRIPPGRIHAYSLNGTFSILGLNGMVINDRSAFEVIKDQHRVVIGDQDSGVFYILRTNAQPTSEFKIYQTEYTAEQNEENKKEEKLEVEEEVTSKKLAKRTAPRGTKSTQTRDKEETSKDQLKGRAARKKNDENEEKEEKKTKPKGKNTKSTGNKNDESMEIEKEGEEEEKEEEKSTRRSSRSRSQKAEDNKSSKKDTKPKAKAEVKAGRGRSEDDKEEKVNDRTKAKKGKKK